MVSTMAATCCHQSAAHRDASHARTCADDDGANDACAANGADDADATDDGADGAAADGADAVHADAPAAAVAAVAGVVRDLMDRRQPDSRPGDVGVELQRRLLPSNVAGRRAAAVADVADVVDDAVRPRKNEPLHFRWMGLLNVEETMHQILLRRSPLALLWMVDRLLMRTRVVTVSRLTILSVDCCYCCCCCNGCLHRRCLCHAESYHHHRQLHHGRHHLGRGHHHRPHQRPSSGRRVLVSKLLLLVPHPQMEPFHFLVNVRCYSAPLGKLEKPSAMSDSDHRLVGVEATNRSTCWERSLAEPVTQIVAMLATTLVSVWIDWSVHQMPLS